MCGIGNLCLIKIVLGKRVMRAPLEILSSGTDKFQNRMQQLESTSPWWDSSYLGVGSEWPEGHVELEVQGLPTSVQVLARKPSWSLLDAKGIIIVLGFGNSLMFCGKGNWGLKGVQFFHGAVMVASGSDGAGAVRVKWKGEERRWSSTSGLKKLHRCPPKQRPKFLSWLSPSPGHLTASWPGASCLSFLCLSFSTTKMSSKILNSWLLWGLYKLTYLKFIACSQCQ